MEFTNCIATPLGFLILKGNNEFISVITFSDEKVNSSKGLPPIAKEAALQLKEYFSAKRKEFTFPIQQVGTDFQQTVWMHLQKIPFGQTRSYLKIAAQLGDPKSIRAVGNANGKNNLAIVIPCHRVIGESGKLVGYAGGLWRKKWLLDHENKIENGVQKLF
ncbi:MAG: methylated-DNA--[protein]-cysteine S-methyltransferase [Bacteroidetes bacterium]|nr:methylated-DNA--[protein]-cysteine S-methyltransferase [Bacteroidota bacterium]